MIDFKKIQDNYSFAYSFVVDNEISLFLSESFNVEKLKNIFSKNIFIIVKDILTNEDLIKKGVINLHENGYVYSFLKIVDGITLKVSVIPKIISITNSEDLNIETLENFNKLLFNFDDLLKKFRNHTKKSKLFNIKNGSFNFIEFETDFKILTNLLYSINNNKVYFEKQQQYILSDILVGDANLEMYPYINEFNILPQLYKSKEESKIKSIIYNTLLFKYNKKFLSFLKENKYNKLINSLFNTINKLIVHPFFLNYDRTPMTIPQLKNLIKTEISKNNENKNLFLELFFLLENNINYDSKTNVTKKVIRLEKVWEQFNENYFQRQYDKISFQGVKNISESNKNKVYFESADSKIDIIWELHCEINNKQLSYFNVADCKYKILDQNGHPNPIDIDKLKRDSDIHNSLSYKEKSKVITLEEKIKLLEKISSYLIYPKKIEINISDFHNKKLVVNEQADYKSQLNKIDFSENLEYQDVNIFTSEVNFLSLINI